MPLMLIFGKVLCHTPGGFGGFEVAEVGGEVSFRVLQADAGAARIVGDLVPVDLADREIL